jgi:HD-like signal output (HDOD) protein
MSILKSLVETQEFATLPPVAARLLNLLEKDDVDIRYISKIIETDAALTIRLLKLANSSLYAIRGEIKSIHQAIIQLGLNRLSNIVLGVSVFSKFLLNSQKDAANLMQKFWWHSSCTGIVAKALSAKINKSFRENEFIGGLLHDIGKLAMLQYDIGKYSHVIESINERHIFDIEAEREEYETDHNEVGKQISILWKLPDELTSIIAYHSKPSEAPDHKELVSVVRFADILCEMWDAGVNEGFRVVDFSKEESWLILCNSYPELSELDVEVFTFELETEFKKSAEFLNMLVGESKG